MTGEDEKILLSRLTTSQVQEAAERHANHTRLVCLECSGARVPALEGQGKQRYKRPAQPRPAQPRLGSSAGNQLNFFALGREHLGGLAGWVWRGAPSIRTLTVIPRHIDFGVVVRRAAGAVLVDSGRAV